MNTLWARVHEILGQWRRWCSRGSSLGIVTKVTGAHGDGAIGVGGVAALLSLLLHPCVVALTTSAPAVTRPTKNRAKKGLKDQGEISWHFLILASFCCFC
jgi:hypothetical protein